MGFLSQKGYQIHSTETAINFGDMIARLNDWYEADNLKIFLIIYISRMTSRQFVF